MFCISSTSISPSALTHTYSAWGPRSPVAQLEARYGGKWYNDAAGKGIYSTKEVDAALAASKDGFKLFFAPSVKTLWLHKGTKKQKFDARNDSIERFFRLLQSGWKFGENTKAPPVQKKETEFQRHLNECKEHPKLTYIGAETRKGYKVHIFRIEKTPNNGFEYACNKMRQAGHHPNVKTLFHGAPIESLNSVLERGLLTNRSAWKKGLGEFGKWRGKYAPGGLFGPGIYFGELQKASGFGEILFKASVALGNSLRTTTSGSCQGQMGDQYQSVHASRGNISGAWGGTLVNDEWIVYDPAQVILEEVWLLER